MPYVVLTHQRPGAAHCAPVPAGPVHNALIFLVPILVMTLLNFVLNSQSSAVTLAVVLPTGSDPATAQVNQILTQAFDQQKENLTVSYITADDADSTLSNGDANGVLIFPADFATRL